MKPAKFKALTTEFKTLSHANSDITWNFRNGGVFDDEKHTENEEKMEKILAELNANAERVNISFYIGNRKYVECGYKVGKSLYRGENRTFEKLYKDSGAKVIPVITEEMNERMMDDTYYY